MNKNSKIIIVWNVNRPTLLTVDEDNKILKHIDIYKSIGFGEFLREYGDYEYEEQGEGE